MPPIVYHLLLDRDPLTEGILYPARRLFRFGSKTLCEQDQEPPPVQHVQLWRSPAAMMRTVTHQSHYSGVGSKNSRFQRARKPKKNTQVDHTLGLSGMFHLPALYPRIPSRPDVRVSNHCGFKSTVSPFLVSKGSWILT